MKKGLKSNIGKQVSEISERALFLRCKNEQDLKVISSLLQDALINNTDFYFSKKESNFLFVANRFCWESVSNESQGKAFNRVLSGVNIQNVISVNRKNLILKNDEQTALFYNLLAIEYDRGKNEMKLVFSQNACVKLNVTKLDIFIKDIEEPYPTQKIPDHFSEKYR